MGVAAVAWHSYILQYNTSFCLLLRTPSELWIDEYPLKTCCRVSLAMYYIISYHHSGVSLLFSIQKSCYKPEWIIHQYIMRVDRRHGAKFGTPLLTDCSNSSCYVVFILFSPSTLCRIFCFGEKSYAWISIGLLCTGNWNFEDTVSRHFSPIVDILERINTLLNAIALIEFLKLSNTETRTSIVRLKCGSY